MTDRPLDTYARRLSPSSPLAEPETLEADMGCFGWLRGVRDRALMLELRKKDGHILAVGYGWIERVEFEPESGITLHVPGRKILIKGSGLNSEARPTIRLFDGIIRHRVPWICEADRAETVQPTCQAIIVERIQWDG